MIGGASVVNRDKSGSCLQRALDPLRNTLREEENKKTVINAKVVAAQGVERACLLDTQQRPGRSGRIPK